MSELYSIERCAAVERWACFIVIAGQIEKVEDAVSGEITSEQGSKDSPKDDGMLKISTVWILMI